MKNLTIKPLSPSIMAAALSIFLLAFVSHAYADVANFKKVHGVVDLFHSGAKQAQPASVGEGVKVGDTIRTGRRSRAQLSFADGSVLNLGSLTKVLVGEFSYSATSKVRKSSLRQFRGTIRAVVSKAQSKDSFYRIETPTAMAAVRGTIMGSLMHSPNDVLFFVIRGTIEVSNKNNPKQKTRVGAGQFTRVVGDNPPTPARKMSAALKYKVLNNTRQNVETADKESGVTSGETSGAASAPIADPASGGGDRGAVANTTGSTPALLNTGKLQAGVGTLTSTLTSVTPPLTKSTPKAVNSNVSFVLQF